MRGFRQSQPSLIVLRLDDQRTAVVERLQNFVWICCDYAEALDDDFVLVAVLALPFVPDPSECEQATIRKRNRPRLTELFLFLLLGQWLPFEEEICRYEATTVFPWRSPGAARLELVGAGIDGAEGSLGRLGPIRQGPIS